MKKLRYTILKDENLILAQILNFNEQIHVCIQEICDMIYNDPEYVDGMDIIVDMKRPTYPQDEFFYNALDNLISVKPRFNRFVRIICPKDEELKKNYKIFQMFAEINQHLSRENHFVNNIKESLTILGKENDNLEPQLIDFFAQA